ncbi:hypothetical protein LPUS_05512 [Lasallia pustulata]|uniref:Uncharacterized protein n=1 Tax=Lasallia pustulata TaxID=136370 RepID=A0A1W5CZB1_9LECA|nr:hypothetical protein LPUS_05512 [Lasallia pustulata]
MASFKASNNIASDVDLDLDLLPSWSKKQPSRRSPTSTSTSTSTATSTSKPATSGAKPQDSKDPKDSKGSAALGARKPRPPQIQIVPITERQPRPSASVLLPDTTTVTADTATAPASPSLLEQTTAPIAIPTANPLHRRDPISRPTTPLTAREEKAGHQFPWHDTSPLRPTISQSLRPTYSFQRQSQRKPKEVSPQKQQLVSLRVQEDVNTGKLNVPSTAAARLHKEKVSSLYTPSSPLSPTMISSTLPSQSRHSNARRTVQPLQLPVLPRYHPSNYERATPSPSVSSNASRPSITYRSSARSPQPHQRQLSDAQYKLHQYQRDIITTATRQPRPARTPTNGPTKPVSPRLNPLGSPGPVTPMMLEEQTDYLLAGAESGGLSPGSFGEKGQTDFVERLVRAGKESGALARSGSNSPVSPAGGRG